MTTLTDDDLHVATGGSLAELAKGGFGLRTVYRGAVKNVTAAVGG